MKEFIDLKTQYSFIEKTINKKIKTVFEHGKFIMGPEVKELESKLSDLTNSKYSIAVSSGTDALYLSLLSLNIIPGDIVFTTPFTFVATAEVISLLGAIPVFVDIDKKTYNISPESLEIKIDEVKKNINDYRNKYGEVSLKAIIAVDLFGLPADYERINKIAKTHNLSVIEDAAQSMGGEINANKAGSFGLLACTSFFPAKPLGGYGDGGAIFTNDPHLNSLIKSLRIHGKGEDKYDNVRIGTNSRLDTIQAAILLAKLTIFEDEIEKRQEISSIYNELLNDVDEITIPYTPNNYKSAWAQYSILLKDKDKRHTVQKNLYDKEYPTAIYYNKPLHLQKAFSYLGYEYGDFPISEDYSSKILSIPMHPYLTYKTQKEISKTIKNSFLKK